MRSPPALRELNVGADRRAQLILRIMRIRLSLLEWIYAVSVRYMVYYTLLKDDDTFLKNENDSLPCLVARSILFASSVWFRWL